jgi:hypothetical protein
MATGKTPQRGSWTFIIVIFVVVLIDAVGLAQVRANYIHDHGYDIPTRHPAAAKFAPPP